MSPTERRGAGRSTSRSKRRASSRKGTRGSRGLPEINISRFKAVTLAPRREAPVGEPVVIPAIVQLAPPIWHRQRQFDESIGQAAERRQSPMHAGKLGRLRRRVNL